MLDGVVRWCSETLRYAPHGRTIKRDGCSTLPTIMDPSRSSYATFAHAPYANESTAHHHPIHSYASALNTSSRAAPALSYQQEQSATFGVDSWSHHPRQDVSYPASHTSAAQEFAPNYASLPYPTTQTSVSWPQSLSWNGFSMANSPPYWMSANATSFPFPESASSSSSYIPADSVRSGTASSAGSLYTLNSAFPSPAEPYSHLGHVKLEQSIEEYPFPGLSQHHAEPSIPPTSDEGDWYPSSLADLHPAPAPKCVPLRITGASADMRRQMGVFRLDPFAMHDGVHAAVKRPLSPGGNSGGLAAPSALRLRDQAVCWNGEHAGPLKEPSVLVEFQVSPFPPSRLAWLLTFRSGAAQRSRKSGPVPGTICASL
jgi:hypothetical protein